MTEGSKMSPEHALQGSLPVAPFPGQTRRRLCRHALMGHVLTNRRAAALVQDRPQARHTSAVTRAYLRRPQIPGISTRRDSDPKPPAFSAGTLELSTILRSIKKIKKRMAANPFYGALFIMYSPPLRVYERDWQGPPIHIMSSIESLAL